MYLHLGEDFAVPYRALIGLFDIDGATLSRDTRGFLSEAERRGEVVNIGEELPKAFAVCAEEGKTSVYICRVSSATLYKRAKTMNSAGRRKEENDD